MPAAALKTNSVPSYPKYCESTGVDSTRGKMRTEPPGEKWHVDVPSMRRFGVESPGFHPLKFSKFDVDIDSMYSFSRGEGEGGGGEGTIISCKSVC